MKGGYDKRDVGGTALRVVKAGRLVIVAVFSLLMLCVSGRDAFADNKTGAGVVSAAAEGATSIAVQIPYTGDDNGSNAVSIKWKLCADASYAPVNTIDLANAASPYKTTITGLSQNTCYSIQVTFTDGDGITGTNPQEFRITSTWDNSLLHNANRFNTSTKWGSAGGWGLPSAKYGRIGCETCHKPVTGNIKRIAGSVTAPNGTDSFPGSTVIFQSTWMTPDSFGDDSDNHTTSTRVCEVCHSITSHHRFDTSGQTDGKSHNNNADCMTCHPHSVGFYYATGACDSCHGNPPTSTSLGGPSGLATPATGALGSSPADAGAHSAHVNTRTMICDTCHKGSNMPAVSNAIQMGFEASPANVAGWGSESVVTGTFTGKSSLNSPYSWANGNAGTTVNTGGDNTCAVYCHGSTLTGGTNASSPVSWMSGSAGKACGSCHGGSDYNVTSANPPSAGSHLTHAGSWSSGARLQCDECHGTTPADMSHLNGSVSWGLKTQSDKFGSPAQYRGWSTGKTAGVAPSSSYGSCTTVYCHSNVQSGSDGTGGPSAWATAQWGNASSGQCGTCHKGDGSGNGTYIDSGSHAKHVSPAGSGGYNMPCSNCHLGAGHNTGSHANYSVDINIDTNWGTESSYSAGSHAPGAGYGSCSNIYCHSSSNFSGVPPVVSFTYTSPSWGSAASGACGTCHGATKEVPPISGSHEMHVRLDADNGYVNQFRCYKCHKNTATNSDPAAISTLGHSDYHVNGTRDVFFWTSDPLVGTAGANFDAESSTCSNIYCHSMGKAGIVSNSDLSDWYSGSPYVKPIWNDSLNCWFCHGKSQPASVERPYGGYPDYTSWISDAGTAKANSHLSTTHNKTKCSVCHNQTTYYDDVNNIIRIRTDIIPTNHVNGTINVSFDPAYVISGQTATYDSDINKTRTCSNVACHGTESGQWGALQTCVDCHEAGALNISGVHNRHWESTAGNATARNTTGNSSTASYYKIQCGTCHPDEAHPRGFIGQNFADVNFNITWVSDALQTSGVYTQGTWTTAVDSRLERISVNGGCANIYCHSSGIAPGSSEPLFSTIAWNATPGSPNDCAVCHGAPPATNRHDVHASTYGFGCVECHQLTVNWNTVIADKSRHVNGINDVAWKTNGRNSDGSAYSGPNCSNIYCHSQGQVNAAPYWTTVNTPNNAAVWTNPQTGQCTGCHNGASGASVVMNTNKHTAHVDNAAVNGVDYACNTCHSATVSGNTTIVDVTMHANKLVDVVWTTLNSWATYTGTNTPGDAVGNCNNLYCHSIGKTTVPGGQLPGGANTIYSNPAWNGAAIGCNGCHGRTTATGYPDYTSGAAGSSSANSHAKHAGSSTGQYGINCSACHYAVTTDGTAINGASPSLHINGNTQDLGFTPAYGTASINISGGWYTAGIRTCGNVYCHSNVQAPGGATLWSTYSSPQWGAGSMTCSSCHKDMSTLQEPTGPTDPDMQYGSHKRHIADGGYQCSLCHGSGYSYTSVSYPTHANGIINISFTGDGTGAVYSQSGYNPPGNSYGNCTSTLCHGRGQRFWGVNTSTTLCEKCHGSANTAQKWTTGGTNIGNFNDTSLSPSSPYAGTHVSHLAATHNLTNPITCDECHTVPPSNDINGVHDPNHWGGLDYTGSSWSGLPARLNWGTLAKTGMVIGANNQTAMSPSYTYTGWDTTPARTCSNTYCHSGVRDTDDSGNDLGPQVATPPYWGQNGFLGGSGCNKCHGYPPPYPHQQNNDCNGCHPHVSVTNTSFAADVVWPVGSGTHVTGKSLHVNGSVEFSVDACLDCHNTAGVKALIGSHSLHSDADYFLSKTPVWTTSPYSWTTGTATTGTASSLTDSSQSWQTNILAGYYVRITNGPNQDIQLKIAGNTTTYLWSSRSWSSIVTAGNTYEIRQARTLTAGDYDDTTWHYQIHYEGGFPKFACGTCHDLTSLSKRNNGVVDIDLDPSHAAAGTVKTKNLAGGPWYTARNTGVSIKCMNVYCHSSGYVSPSTSNFTFKTTPDWYWSEQSQPEPFGQAGVDRCSQCHGNSPNTGGIEGSAAHAQHVVAVHYRDIYSGNSGKMAQGWTTSADGVHGNTATSTTINCNICHYDTVKVSYNDDNGVCATCHGSNAKGAMTVDSANTTHINGNVDVAFSGSLWGSIGVKSKAQLRDNITAISELNSNWTRQNGYKASTSYDSSKPTPSYNAGTCLNAACHNGTPMEWSQTGPLRCAACHKGLPQ